MPFKNELMAMASKSNPFGIQLWSVKQALAKDTLGVLKQIAANGYKKIESFEGPKGMFWGMKNTEFKKLMDDLGMNIVSTHCNDTGNFKTFEQKAAAMEADPVPRFRARLIADRIASEDELAAFEAEVEGQIDEALEFALSSPWPTADDLRFDVFEKEIAA